MYPSYDIIALVDGYGFSVLILHGFKNVMFSRLKLRSSVSSFDLKSLGSKYRWARKWRAPCRVDKSSVSGCFCWALGLYDGPQEDLLRNRILSLQSSLSWRCYRQVSSRKIWSSSFHGLQRMRTSDNGEKRSPCCVMVVLSRLQELTRKCRHSVPAHLEAL